MSARQQLLEAAEEFRQADKDCTNKRAGVFTNSARQAAYHRWIAALYRFKRESVKGRPE